MADVIALFVLDARNDYQDALVRSARFCCERRGLQLEVHDAGNSSDKQLQQIIACVRGPARARTAALLVHPVLDGMHEQAAQEAARVGLGWVLLNRVGAYVTDLRQRYPQVPLFAVTPDQVEIGRMQGRAVRALLPSGGRVLYVQGPLMASSSRARASGMEEVLKDAGVAVQSLRGDWSARSGEQTVSLWLLRALPAGEVSDLVVAQNDAMASGARSALAAAAREHGRPELAELPIVGCDGVTAFGARLVKEGVLTATVVVPGTAAPAVDEIVRMRQGGPPPPAELRLPVTLQPDPSALRPLTNRRTAKSPGGL